MLAAQGLAVEQMRRNYRLFDDQSQIGRVGAVASRLAQRLLAPVLFRNLMAYQYLVVARRDNKGLPGPTDPD
jgi:hypothetical protein